MLFRFEMSSQFDVLGGAKASRTATARTKAAAGVTRKPVIL